MGDALVVMVLHNALSVSHRLLVGDLAPGEIPQTVDIDSPSDWNSASEEDNALGADVDLVSADPVADSVTELPASPLGSSGTTSPSSGSTPSETATSTASSTTAYYRSSARHGPTAASGSTRPKRPLSKPRSRREQPAQPAPRERERPTPSSARVAELLRDAVLRDRRDPGLTSDDDQEDIRPLALTRYAFPPRHCAGSCPLRLRNGSDKDSARAPK